MDVWYRERKRPLSLGPNFHTSALPPLHCCDDPQHVKRHDDTANFSVGVHEDAMDAAPVHHRCHLLDGGVLIHVVDLRRHDVLGGRILLHSPAGC